MKGQIIHVRHKWLKEQKESTSQTWEQIAAKLGVHVSTVYRSLREKRDLKVDPNDVRRGKRAAAAAARAKATRAKKVPSDDELNHALAFAGASGDAKLDAAVQSLASAMRAAGSRRVVIDLAGGFVEITGTERFALKEEE